MTAKEIKYYLLVYWKKRNYNMAATEVNPKHPADVMAYKWDEVVEVEIKISESDLNKEKVKKSGKTYSIGIGADKYTYKKFVGTKYRKHDSYSQGNGPNRFYFCVPEIMSGKTLAFTNQYFPKYGVMAISEQGKVRVVRRAKVLRVGRPENLVKMIQSRVSWDFLKLVGKEMQNEFPDLEVLW